MSHIAQVQPSLSQLPRLSGNIYCIGRNYADHARELGNAVPSEPVIFLKAPSALRPLAQGPLGFSSEIFHHEVELCLLLEISASGQRRVSVAGIALGIDLTRRTLQDQLKKDGLPWCKAKSFAGSAIITDFIAADQLDLKQIDFQLYVNEELKQSGHTGQMIFNCTEIVDYLNEQQELETGDLIFTGTPAGVGPLKRGDRLRLISQAMQMDERGIL